MTKLRLGDESINFSQEILSKVDIIKENKIGGVSSYEVDSNGGIVRAKFDVGDSFSDIKSVDSYGLYYAFRGCTGLTGSVSFPNLISVGDNGLGYAFRGCTGLTGSVSFPNLISVGDYGLYYAFDDCTGLTSVSFPNLTSIGGNGLFHTFYDCTGLTGSVSFPSLTTLESIMVLEETFYNCTGITEIHFRADAKATIEAQRSYSSKFGATNATIYFDL